jgi:hypothetical protein
LLMFIEFPATYYSIRGYWTEMSRKMCAYLLTIYGSQ